MISAGTLELSTRALTSFSGLFANNIPHYSNAALHLVHNDDDRSWYLWDIGVRTILLGTLCASRPLVILYCAIQEEDYPPRGLH